MKTYSTHQLINKIAGKQICKQKQLLLFGFRFSSPPHKNRSQQLYTLPHLQTLFLRQLIVKRVVYLVDLERAGWDVECNASLDRAPANETPMLLNAPAEGQLLELVGAYWSGER